MVAAWKIVKNRVLRDKVPFLYPITYSLLLSFRRELSAVWPEVFEGANFHSWLVMHENWIHEIKSLNARSCDGTITGGVTIAHACHCWIDLTALTAGLLHTSSLLVSFFYTNVSSLDHMWLVTCAITRSPLSTSMIDHLLVFHNFLASSNEIWAWAMAHAQ